MDKRQWNFYQTIFENVCRKATRARIQYTVVLSVLEIPLWKSYNGKMPFVGCIGPPPPTPHPHPPPLQTPCYKHTQRSKQQNNYGFIYIQIIYI